MENHDGNDTLAIHLQKCNTWQFTQVIQKVRLQMIALIMPPEWGNVTKSIKMSPFFWYYVLYWPLLHLWMNEMLACIPPLVFEKALRREIKHTLAHQTVRYKFSEKRQEVAELKTRDDSPRPLSQNGCRLVGSQWAGHWMPMRKTHPELDRRRSGRVAQHSRQQ